MQRARITKTFVSDKNKEGVAFKDKNGKPFWKMGIQVDGKDDWYTCLFFRQEELPDWNEGDEVTVTLEEVNGYKNFKVPNRYDIIESRINSLQIRVERLEGSKIPNTNVDYPTSQTSNGDGTTPVDDVEVPF